MLRLYQLPAAQERASGGSFDALLNGAGDMVGGLAQALGPEEEMVNYGLSIVQLKRALRGAAHAEGALYPLHSEGVIDKRTSDELHDAFHSFQTDIYGQLAEFRQRAKDGF
jgi:hypothetical protein